MSKYFCNNYVCCVEERVCFVSYKKCWYVEDLLFYWEVVCKVRWSDIVSFKKRKVEGILVEESKKVKWGGVDSSVDKYYLCNVCFEFFLIRIGLSNYKCLYFGYSDFFVCFICYWGFVFKWNLLRYRDF